ncbi:MAG: tyrosine-type recombinase/integrase [Deltaproteobacteria bacterium]|nr:tyrosine-type recombinase/integrase [Deltaproteobacteria bacterium]
MRITEAIATYLNYLTVLGRARTTVRGTKYGLRDFNRFLITMNIHFLADLNRDVILEYQRELAYRLTAKGTPLSLRSQGQLLGVVKNLCRYLKEKEYLIIDLAESLVLPKKPKNLPKVILDNTEIKKILAAPDMHTNRGYRNRVVLEILYDTGIRAAEMAAIKTSNLDLTNGYLTIRKGKGSKDRVVPLNTRVCRVIESYLLMVRPALLQGKDTGYLVLNRWGERMTTMAVWSIVKKCVKLSGIKKNITTHTFRHTCATHMLKNGAPIRHIQELLGHESLESTQIYTKVTINDLKAIHAKYHPGESLPIH